MPLRQFLPRTLEATDTVPLFDLKSLIESAALKESFNRQHYRAAGLLFTRSAHKRASENQSRHVSKRECVGYIAKARLHSCRM